MKSSVSNPSLVLALALAFLLFACSNSGDGRTTASNDSGSGGSGGDSHHGSGGTSGGSGSGGMGGMMMDGAMMMDGGGSGIHAPVMQSAMPLSGGLHVMWMNMTNDCDKIELLRNENGGAFAVAYTLAGTATSQHDAGATAAGTYCYKARCVRGSETSSDSNEACGTP